MEEVKAAFAGFDLMRYDEVVFCGYGEPTERLDALLEIAKGAREYVPHVVLSTVDTTLTKEEEEQCRKICDSLGVIYRIRPWRG